MLSFKKTFILTLSLSLLSAQNIFSGDELGTQNNPIFSKVASDPVPELNISTLITEFKDYGRAHPSKMAFIAFLVWSIVIFETTEPTSKPARYMSLDNLYECISKAIQGENTTDNLKKLLLNGKYLILDGLIGHKFKAPSMRVYPNDSKISAQLCESLVETYDDINPTTNLVGNLILRPGAYQKGLYGNLHLYTGPVIKGLGFIGLCATYQKDILKGLRQTSKLLN